MSFEIITLVPGPEAKASMLTERAALLKTRRRIQDWAISPDGVGITLSLYPPTSGCADDFKADGGYPAYRAWVLTQMAPAGFVEKVAQPPAPEPVAQTDSAPDLQSTLADLPPAQPAEEKPPNPQPGAQHKRSAR